MSSQPGLQTDKTMAVETDPRLSPGTKEFLKVFNSPAPPELEKLSPKEAREGLVGLQTSVDVDYSGIEESEKTITANGYEIKLNIVRPEGVSAKLPVFIFIHGGGWVLGDYLHTNGWCAIWSLIPVSLLSLSITRAHPMQFTRTSSMRFTRLADGLRKTATRLMLMERIWQSSGIASAAI